MAGPADGQRILNVLFGKKKKPHERFYLFPGQGGRNYRRKHRRELFVATLVAIVAGLVLGGIMYLLARHRY